MSALPGEKMDELPFVALGTHPISGDLPAGEDARYEPEYATVLEEIDKLSFSGQGAAISWPVVEKNAVLLLAEKSKDLQIAAYLGVALWNTRGFEGVACGIRILGGLLENFWDTAWPPLKRMRGRVNALDWWHERTYGFLQGFAANGAPITAEQQGELLERIVWLDTLASTLLPDASSMRDLSAAAQRLPVLAENRQEEAPPSPAEQAKPLEAPVSASPPAPAPVSVVPQASAFPEAAPVPPLPDSGDPAALRRHFLEAGQLYLASARGADPANAVLWQLSRLLVWGNITALPPAEDGLTLLPTPDMDFLERAQQILDTGNARQAAAEAEEFFSLAPFCLDAQRLVHAALTAQGAAFAEAANAVREETVKFIARLPGVEKLAFTDGTPFASPRTVQWLQESAVRRQAGKVRPAPLPQRPSLLPQTREPGSLAEQLDRLDASKTDSLSVNFGIGVRQLRLLWEEAGLEAALPLAEALLQEIADRDMDRWDPPFALEALVAIREVFALSPSGHEKELRETRRRIARISPSAALE